MIQRFLELYRPLLPKTYKSIVTRLSTHPNLILHYGVTPFAQCEPHHPSTLGLKSSSNNPIIKRGLSILMCSGVESFTSNQLQGATPQD